MSNWVSHPGFVEFYKRYRCRPADLYPSERAFVPWLARRITTMLDVGCAAGGFSSIFHHFNPGIRYVGTDVSERVIGEAARLCPEDRFAVADATLGLPYAASSFDLAFATGVLHWNPEFRPAIEELWRVAKQYVLFDVRLTDEADRPVVWSQKIQFDAADWDGRTLVPYVLVPWRLATRLVLAELAPRPLRALGYGYWGKPAETVLTETERVCFAVFVLEKAAEENSEHPVEVSFDLPLELPSGLPAGVHVLEKGALWQLVGGGGD